MGFCVCSRRWRHILSARSGEVLGAISTNASVNGKVGTTKRSGRYVATMKWSLCWPNAVCHAAAASTLDVNSSRLDECDALDPKPCAPSSCCIPIPRFCVTFTAHMTPHHDHHTGHHARLPPLAPPSTSPSVRPTLSQKTHVPVIQQSPVSRYTDAVKHSWTRLNQPTLAAMCDREVGHSAN